MLKFDYKRELPWGGHHLSFNRTTTKKHARCTLKVLFFSFFLQHCNYDESFLGLLSASFFSQSATAVFAGNVVCLVYCIIATTTNINLIKVL